MVSPRGTRVVSSRRTRELGQNFLVDRNILDLIVRFAELRRTDVVLEVGGGHGVLSERLAENARHVHVVEVDPRLEQRLRATLVRFENVTLHVLDALAADLAALRPEPDKVVANLPYGIAATLILRTIEELPGVSRWVVMVQREVGQRLASAPGTVAYGVPSVLAQVACDVRVLRTIGRTVFRPVPNVDSVILGLERRSAAAGPELRSVVRGAFAHRRKALARSLAIAAGDDPTTRERARTALAELGLPVDARAEQLSPAEFVELQRLMAALA